jgi:prepilin-type N-terminal cleavage/methylation domain-containing protein
MMRRVSFAGAGASAHRRFRARSGFTLAELMVSVVIITVGVLALAGSSVGVIRQMRSGNQSALAAAVAQARLENIRSRSCTSLTSGTATTRGMSEEWTINSGSVANPAPARIVAVAETVTYVPRRGVTKTLGLTGWVPCI